MKKGGRFCAAIRYVPGSYAFAAKYYLLELSSIRFDRYLMTSKMEQVSMSWEDQEFLKCGTCTVYLTQV